MISEKQKLSRRWVIREQHWDEATIRTDGHGTVRYVRWMAGWLEVRCCSCLLPGASLATVSGLPSCFAGGCVAALPTESDGDRSPLLASGVVVADADDCDGLASTFWCDLGRRARTLRPADVGRLARPVPDQRTVLRQPRQFVGLLRPVAV